MYVVNLEDADNQSEFGFKAASLASLKKSGLPVPSAFVIPPAALELFISRNGLREKIHSVSEITDRNPNSIKSVERNIREVFVNALIPTEIKKPVLSAYERLSIGEEVRHADAAMDLIRAGRNHELVALRCSIIREADNSFAGVTNNFLNVEGEDELWEGIKLCWASLFYPHARLYMERMGINDIKMAILVQRMVDAAKSGSVLTNFGNEKVLVEGTWGLGEAWSSGIVTPDEYLLDRNGSLLEKNIAKKFWMYERNVMTGKTEKQHVPGSKMDAQVLTDVELRKLCELADKVQKSLAGQQIVDWCIGRNRAFIVDSKPGYYEISNEDAEEGNGEVVITGRCASPGTISGRIGLFSGEEESSFNAADILVSRNSSTATLLSCGDVAGFITNEGGRLCNFSVLARELKIPALTATQNASSILKEGDSVKLLAQQGKVVTIPGTVIGEFPHEQSESPITDLPLLAGVPEKETDAGFVPETPLTGTKTFARIGSDNIEKIAGVDGFVLFQVSGEADTIPSTDSIDAYVESIRSLGSVPVWLLSKSERDFPQVVNVAKRLGDSGLGGVGVLIPITRGGHDIDRWRHQIPANVKIGVSIKTPAMAFSIGSIIKGGVNMVNLELNPLVQLSMGLKSPDMELHSAFLDLISSVIEKCRESSVQCCISLPGEHLSDGNIESLVRQGTDAICVEPGMIQDLNNFLSRAERRLLLAKGIIKSEEGTQEDSPPSDFTSSFSLP